MIYDGFVTTHIWVDNGKNDGVGSTCAHDIFDHIVFSCIDDIVIVYGHDIIVVVFVT